jgi:hypothetical protein
MEQNRLYGKVNIDGRNYTLILAENLGGNSGKVIAVCFDDIAPNRYHDAVRVSNTQNISDDEMRQIVGENNWKPIRKVSVALNETYTAVTYEGATEIKVGCQTIPVEALRAVLRVVDGEEEESLIGKQMNLGDVPVGQYVKWPTTPNIYLRTKKGVKYVKGGSSGSMKKGEEYCYEPNSDIRVYVVAKP